MNDLITMRELGRYGRWANQLLQHNFLICYATRNGIRYAAPPWMGQDIFGFQDDPVEIILPRKRERYYSDGMSQKPLPPEPMEFNGYDFIGYGQVHTSWLHPVKEAMRSLYRPCEKQLDRLMPNIDSLRQSCGTLIGLQIRRSDYGHGFQYRTPIRWYKDWLRRHLPRFKNPLVFVESEDRDLWKKFEPEFAPVWTSERLGIPWSTDPLHDYDHCTHFPEDKRTASPSFTDFFTNWWILANCDVLLCSNSTYGFTAAMFSTQNVEAWRSNLPAQTFIPFDPWWDNPMEYNSLERWPGIPGTQVDDNPFAPTLKNKYPAVPDPEETP